MMGLTAVCARATYESTLSDQTDDGGFVEHNMEEPHDGGF